MDEEARGRIANVVRSIELLKWDWMGWVRCRRQWRMISPKSIMEVYNSL